MDFGETKVGIFCKLTVDIRTKVLSYLNKQMQNKNKHLGFVSKDES